jgi:Asp-tRNA(Asn)/Glu-tRNA(Gln) amidotransferase A subunit family amidase
MASYDVTEKSIAHLQSDIGAGVVKSSELVQCYLERIESCDVNGPSLNAVLYVNPSALQDAQALDDERAIKGPRSPLHGIPVLLKDNYDTKDMPTTGASLVLTGVVPDRDAFQVRKLREAGAVLLGKVNLHELALGLTTHSSLCGQTLNPYDLRRAPGGSSGGSAVAVAANLAAFAMGTDTSGSIRVPSSHNSIVGIRPTAGLSSRQGIIPFSFTQDTGGPMAKTVQDIALVLDATTGYDPGDPVTLASRGKLPDSYTSSLKGDGLRGARIGVLHAFFGESPEDDEVSDVVRSALDVMESLGAMTVDVDIPNVKDLLASSSLLAQELKYCLPNYLAAAKGTWATTVEDLLASGLISTTLEPFLARVIAEDSKYDDYLSSDDYKSRLAARQTLANKVSTLMDGHQLDAIAFPITRRIAPIIGENQTGSNAGLSAQTGFPEISVPAGFTPGGFPVGIDLLGRAFSEPVLLRLAFAFEQATHRRRPPPLPVELNPPTPIEIPWESRADTSSTILVATGAQAVPPCEVPFEAELRVQFNASTHELAYGLRPAGDVEQIAGIYLHRRREGEVGGVAHLLWTPSRPHHSGSIILSSDEVDDLTGGKMYVSLVSKESQRLSARVNVMLPGA